MPHTDFTDSEFLPPDLAEETADPTTEEREDDPTPGEVGEDDPFGGAPDPGGDGIIADRDDDDSDGGTTGGGGGGGGGGTAEPDPEPDPDPVPDFDQPAETEPPARDFSELSRRERRRVRQSVQDVSLVERGILGASDFALRGRLGDEETRIVLGERGRRRLAARAVRRREATDPDFDIDRFDPERDLREVTEGGFEATIGRGGEDVTVPALAFSQEAAGALEARAIDRVKQEAEAQLESVTGRDLEPGEDVVFERTEEGIRAELSSQAEREIATSAIERRLEAELGRDVEPGREFTVERTESGFTAAFTPTFTEELARSVTPGGAAFLQAQGGEGSGVDVDVSVRREEVPLTEEGFVATGVTEEGLLGSSKTRGGVPTAPDQAGPFPGDVGDFPVFIRTGLESEGRAPSQRRPAPGSRVRVEDVLRPASEDYSRNVRDIAEAVDEPLAAFPRAAAGGLEAVGQEEAATVLRESSTAAARGFVIGAGELFNVPGVALGFKEAGEFGAFGVEETLAGRGGEFLEDTEVAAEAVAASVLKSVRERPVETAGIVAGSLAVSAGVITGAGRVGGFVGRFRATRSIRLQEGIPLDEIAAAEGRTLSGPLSGARFRLSMARRAARGEDIPLVSTPAAQAGIQRAGNVAQRRAATAAALPIQPGEELAGAVGFRATRALADEATAERFFPQQEPLIFSEEAAIRGARRTGRRLRGLVSRGEVSEFRVGAGIVPQGRLETRSVTETEVDRPDDRAVRRELGRVESAQESELAGPRPRSEFAGATDVLAESVLDEPGELRGVLDTDIENVMDSAQESMLDVEPGTRPRTDTGIESLVRTEPGARVRTDAAIDTEIETRLDLRSEIELETELELELEVELEGNLELESFRFDKQRRRRRRGRGSGEAFEKTFTSPIGGPGTVIGGSGGDELGGEASITGLSDGLLDDDL